MFLRTLLLAEVNHSNPRIGGGILNYVSRITPVPLSFPPSTSQIVRKTLVFCLDFSRSNSSTRFCSSDFRHSETVRNIIRSSSCTLLCSFYKSRQYAFSDICLGTLVN